MRAVCWRLSTWDPRIASVRYRAAIPAAQLALRGVTSQFSAGPYGVLGPNRPDVVVFVKAFGDRDVELAREAAREDVPVIVDVCDNVFARGYGAHSSENLRLIAEVASAVVTTGPALEEVVRRQLRSDLAFHVVPDPVETPENTRAAARAVWRNWFRRASLERRTDLPRVIGGVLSTGVIPALQRSVARPRNSDVPQVLWFGNPGSVEPRFGLVNLADIGGELERAAGEIPFRLVVMTGDRAAYRRQIEPLALDTEFARWDRLTIFQRLRESRVVVVPNSRDEFSICKSANRPALALARGVPVVASRIPSLDALEGVMLFDDFHAGVVTYLRDRDLAAEHVRLAAGVIEREFSPEVVGAAWFELLDAALRVPVRG